LKKTAAEVQIPPSDVLLSGEIVIMTAKRDLILELVPILALRPTQITVGMHEVEEKRKRWRDFTRKKKAKVLGNHMIPVVKGADKTFFVIDHHHLALALHDEGVKEVQITVVADLSMVPRKSFWIVMDDRRWVHPYDENGERQAFSKIPERVSKLRDDPYRSVAGQLRRAGGYAKDTTPFSEFLWANFLRERIAEKTIKRDFSNAMVQALELAKSHDAIYLPGWCGPAED
jgi:hypothetical protein